MGSRVQVLRTAAAHLLLGAGTSMSYRTSARPDDVTASEPARTLPANTGRGGHVPGPGAPGARGDHVPVLARRELQPDVSASPTAADNWSAPDARLGGTDERPYMKVDSDGEDTIHLASPTAIHESGRQHLLRRLPRRQAVPGRRDAHRRPRHGDRPGRQPTPCPTPAARPGCTTSRSTRPARARVASFTATADHRYMYARWTGSAWVTHELTPRATSATTARASTTAAAHARPQDPNAGLPLAAGRGQVYEIRRGPPRTAARRGAAARSRRSRRPRTSVRLAAGLLAFSIIERRLDARGLRRAHRLRTWITTPAVDRRNASPVAMPRSRRAAARRRRRSPSTPSASRDRTAARPTAGFRRWKRRARRWPPATSSRPLLPGPDRHRRPAARPTFITEVDRRDVTRARRDNRPGGQYDPTDSAMLKGP